MEKKGKSVSSMYCIYVHIMVALVFTLERFIDTIVGNQDALDFLEKFDDFEF